MRLLKAGQFYANSAKCEGLRAINPPPVAFSGCLPRRRESGRTNGGAGQGIIHAVEIGYSQQISRCPPPEFRCALFFGYFSRDAGPRPETRPVGISYAPCADGAAATPYCALTLSDDRVFHDWHGNCLVTGEPEETKQQGEAVHNHEEQELNAQQLQQPPCAVVLAIAAQE